MARNVDPDRSADCHATGSVPTAAYLVKGVKVITVCGHHLTKAVSAGALRGWTIIPVQRTRTPGVGTESTPNHFALEG